MHKNNNGKFHVNFKLNKFADEKMEHKQINSIFCHSDMSLVTEFIKNKFYFATLIPGRKPPKHTSDIYFFCIDNNLVYENFYSDFGPLSLACLYKYCWKVNHKLNNPRYYHKQIVHYTTHDEEKRSNAAFLVASYAILYLQMSPKDAYKILFAGNLQQQFRNFQDASVGRSPYTIRLQDCLNAVYKAATFGFFNFEDFDVTEYEKYQQLKYGDLNWIVPQKFLAFIGPSTEPGTAYHPPEHYVDYFLENGVKTVVRLNRESYDASRFTKNGISHYELFLPDGSIPSRKILNKFLKLAEHTDGPIAVHCKAGLGRTGSLIAAYLIKHYKMTAKEAIAWTRICRPGSVIGHQQSWLENIQNELWQLGEQYKLRCYGNSEALIYHKRGIYPIINKSDGRNNSKSLKNHSQIKKSEQSNNYEESEGRCMKHSRSNECESKAKENPGSSKSSRSGIVRIFEKLSGGQKQKRRDEALDNGTETPMKCRHNSTTTEVRESNFKNSNFTQGDLMNRIKLNRAS